MRGAATHVRHRLGAARAVAKAPHAASPQPAVDGTPLPPDFTSSAVTSKNQKKAALAQNVSPQL